MLCPGPSRRLRGPCHGMLWGPWKKTTCLDYFLARSLIIVRLMKSSLLAISQFSLVLLVYSIFPVSLLNVENFKLSFL